MDPTLLRALAAAARAFADEIDRGLGSDAGQAMDSPVAGSPQSMFQVLRAVSAINGDQARGASDADMREIARRAGMDPRGMAGYYAANLLEKRPDGTRWLTRDGQERLRALSRVVLLDSTRPGGPGSPAGSPPVP
ncbi:MAG TPA: hypothetical protein VFZ25_20615 [Chloroflexota bacterium]|nr:hypothetical protein [Chloroflexota bacterium]